MPMVKAVVQNRRKDGTYDVRIRVIHNKAIRRISTYFSVTDEDF